MSVECQVNIKSQSELDIGGHETFHIIRVICSNSASPIIIIVTLITGC